MLKIPLTTLATVKDFLKITTTADDAVLTRLILAASDMIDRYCDLPGFGTANATTIYVDGSNSGILDLPVPVRALTGVSVRTYISAAYSALPVNSWFFGPTDAASMGFPYTQIQIDQTASGQTIGLFYRGPAAVMLTGDFGYATVPAAVEEACIEVVSALHKRRLAGADVLGENQLGQPVVGNVLSAFTKLALEPYRRGMSIAGSGPSSLRAATWLF